MIINLYTQTFYNFQKNDFQLYLAKTEEPYLFGLNYLERAKVDGSIEFATNLIPYDNIIL